MADFSAGFLASVLVWAMPKMHMAGGLICGDSGGWLNGMRLKGIHTAIKSGMLAAETLFECLLADDFSILELTNGCQ